MQASIFIKLPSSYLTPIHIVTFKILFLAKKKPQKQLERQYGKAITVLILNAAFPFFFFSPRGCFVYFVRVYWGCFALGFFFGGVDWFVFWWWMCFVLHPPPLPNIIYTTRHRIGKITGSQEPLEQISLLVTSNNWQHCHNSDTVGYD